MSAESLCQFRPGNCSKRHMMITYGVFHPSYDPELRDNGAYKPREIFNCSMTSPDPMCKPFNCLGSIKTTYYRPPTQLCYTINPSDVAKFQECPTPWNWELNFRVTWNPKHTMLFFDTRSLPIIIHSRSICPPEKLSAVTLQPGKSYILAVKQQQIERLPTPYKSHCTDYFAHGYFQEFQGYLTYDTCMQQCEMQLEMDICSCVRPAHEFSGSFGFKMCKIQESDACYRQLNESGKYQSCEGRCGLPCKETVYDVRVANVAEEPTTASM
ncbi:amiloride-sensitive sodium channel subunit delta-like [Ornithodoros turicata]|uniref:amiloride-sensitive sodium channel subunit delta-like n=1 Tax=Ornithodoros turicata TaxID=34597 RepID=UPI0031391188